MKPATSKPAEQREELLEQYTRRHMAEMWSAWSNGELQGCGDLSIEEAMALIEAGYYSRLN